MTYTYYLEFSGEELELLQSTDAIGCEREFFDRLVSATNQKQLHLIETQVTLLFDKFDTTNHRSNSWCDNLKTLLAHGFSLNRNGHPLKKTYIPLTFRLILPKANEHIHFGRFYRAIHELPEDQFIKFCRVTEYPPGIHQHILSLNLTSTGGSLLAIDPHEVITLIKRDPTSDVISGFESIFEFLSKSL